MSSSIFFPLAKQPDIIRANQKDDYYRRMLYDQILEALHYLLGPRRCMSIMDEIGLISDLCYYGTSTLLGNQTLGEEYCDIQQVCGTRKIPVQFGRRVLLLVWHLIVPYAFDKIYSRLLKISRQREYDSVNANNGAITVVDDRKRMIMAKYLPLIRVFLETLQRVHIAIFYFTGGYFHIAKRQTNIIYIMNRAMDGDRPRYDVLGVLIFAQLVISFVRFMNSLILSARSKKLLDDPIKYDLSTMSWLESSGKCSLCLEIRKSTTATSCGHLYCWTCIASWCNNKPECPLCRMPQKKNELVPVYHYN